VLTIAIVNEDTLSGLVLNHLVTALQLVNAAAELTEVPEPDTLGQLHEITNQCQQLEVGAVMLLLQSGVSWATMAQYSGGVTRQSLHYRLSRKVDERLVQPKETDGPGLQTQWRRQVQLLVNYARTLSAADPNELSHRIARSLLARGKAQPKGT
jgi:hypothetical protein